MSHPAQLLSDPRRPYVPQGPSADSAPPSGRNRALDLTPNPPPPSPSDPTALPAPFNPPEPITRKLLRQLVDPTLSLTTIADTHNTDLDSLCAWMAREDIRQRFHNFRSACAERTRAAAENCLSMVVQTAHAVIHEFHDDQHHMNFKPQDPQGHEIKRRNRETAMRAGRLLLRLARYYSLDLTRTPRDAQPAHTPPPGTPTLRGGSPSSPTSHIRHPKSDTPNPTSELLLSLLDNPALADQLTQALAAKQAQVAAPAPHASPSEISNLKSEIPPSPPAPAPQSEIPNPQSEIPPKPAQRPKQNHYTPPTIPPTPSPPHPLNSSPPHPLPAAGTATPRAP